MGACVMHLRVLGEGATGLRDGFLVFLSRVRIDGVA